MAYRPTVYITGVQVHVPPRPLENPSEDSHWNPHNFGSKLCLYNRESQGDDRRTNWNQDRISAISWKWCGARKWKVNIDLGQALSFRTAWQLFFR